MLSIFRFIQALEPASAGPASEKNALGIGQEVDQKLQVVSALASSQKHNLWPQHPLKWELEMCDSARETVLRATPSAPDDIEEK